MHSPIKIDIPQLISAGTAFAFISSSCYLLGYWYSFGIPIFEYLTISDILARSVFPLSFMVFAFIGIVASRYQEVRKKEHNSTGISSKKLEAILACVLFSTAGLVDQFFLKTGGFWTFYSCAFSLLILTIFIQTGWAQSFIENFNLPRVALLLIVFTPILTYGHAKSTSYKILNKISFLNANFEAGYNILGEHAFLGEAGDSVFFWSYEKNGTLIIRKSEVKKLLITENTPLTRIRKLTNN